MLRHRQQLDGGVAHFLDIGRQLFRQIPVVDEVPIVPLFPRPQVHLVDIQGRVIDLVPVLPLPESGVRPPEATDVIQLAGGGGAGLCVEAIWIRFQPDHSIRTADRVLIGCVLLQSGDEALPDLALAGKLVGTLIPVIEVAHHGHASGTGSPDPEAPALPALFLRGVRTEPAPAIAQRTGMEPFGLFVFRHVKLLSPPVPLSRKQWVFRWFFSLGPYLCSAWFLCNM